MSQTKWTRRISRPVSVEYHRIHMSQVKLADLPSELDALGLDDEPIGEGETPSYLQDSQALPDFIDAAPVEENLVSRFSRDCQRLAGTSDELT